MSYESEVLADNPALYYRVDTVGPASNGDPVPDISTNNLEGILELSGSAPINPWGNASPVETDPSSRSFFCHNDPGISKAIITRASTSEIEPSGNFALEILIKPGGLAQDFVAKEKNFDGVCFKISISAGGSFVGTMLDSASTAWTVTAPNMGGGQNELIGRWWHVVLVRFGNALSIYVDKELRATTTITSGLPTLSEGGQFRISGGISGDFSFYVDEVALYTNNLTGTRIGVHYDELFNATALNGYSNVVPSAILYSDEELPPISFPFRHNWDDPLIERISFVANNSKSRSGMPEGNQPSPTPRREIEISQMLRDDSERRKFRAKLWAHQDRKWFVPMREDFEQLSTSLSSGVNSIPVIPQYKDYDVDSWIGVREINDAGQIVKSEELEIQTLNAPTGPIVTKTNLVNSYQSYLSYAYPVRRAYLDRSVPVKGHTDAVEDLVVVARLVAEDEKTVPNRITPWTPTITRDGYEVLDPSIWQSNDWSDLRDYDVDRDVQDVDFEVGSFQPTSDTVGAEEAFSYKITLEGRDKISQFLGWFYAREGSLNYLWVPTMQKDFKIVSAAGSNLTVEGLEYTENYALAQSRSDLAFVYHDNTMSLRKVLSFSGSPNETLVLDPNVPTQTNLRSVSLLKFCQMDGNSLEIAKITDNKWRFAWRFREFLFTP